MTYIVIGLLFIVVGIIAVALAAYYNGKEERPTFLWVVGIVVTICGLVLLTLGVDARYAFPDIPIGAQLTVAARYVSVDGDSKVVLHWQEGKEKPDNEATVSTKQLEIENDSETLTVGETIVKLANGKIVVFSDSPSQ